MMGTPQITEGMFTSARLDWETPEAFFRQVDAEFGFTLDAAASPHNAKCPSFLTEEDDALTAPWVGRVWCNPPYGRKIGRWVEKGFSEVREGVAQSVVMLIPARTDTTYWHEFVMRAHEVRLIRGRLVFGHGEATSNAPFPSALVVFRRGHPMGAPRFSSMDRGLLTKRAA
jgi:site-specific DNA-methyltransferase (adenine-specific)